MRQRLFSRLGAGVAALTTVLAVAGPAGAAPFPPTPAKFAITPAVEPGKCATVERRGIQNDYLLIPRPCDRVNTEQQFTYDPGTKNLKSVSRPGDCVTVFGNPHGPAGYQVQKCGNSALPQQFTATPDGHIKSEPSRIARKPSCMDYANYGSRSRAFLAQACGTADTQNFAFVPVP